MTMSDPIADMLTRIRNANTAKHDSVDIPSSKMKIAIANILVEEGYVEKYELVDNGNFKDIRIFLKYTANKSERIISGLKRISKPDYKKDTAFIIGNEAAGISKEILDMADKKIKIPMLGEVESLNAAVAGSILMYEAVRQRRL